MFREARKAVCSDTGVGSSTSFPITSLLTCGVIQLLSLADVWLGPPSSSSAVPVVGQGPSPAGWDSQCLGSTDGSDQHLQGCSDSWTAQDVIIPWIISVFVLLLLVSLRGDQEEWVLSLNVDDQLCFFCKALRNCRSKRANTLLCLTAMWMLPTCASALRASSFKAPSGALQSSCFHSWRCPHTGRIDATTLNPFHTFPVWDNSTRSMQI